MITVQILEDHDIILATDWCRPLLLITMTGGHSDYYSFESMYTGQPENNVTWVTADQILGEHWIGQTVGEYNAAISHCGPEYEFLRGDVPASHQYGKTNRQLSEEHETWIQTTKVHIGKYTDKGYTWADIRDMDYSYFEWAKNTIIRDGYDRHQAITHQRSL